MEAVRRGRRASQGSAGHTGWRHVAGASASLCGCGEAPAPLRWEPHPGGRPGGSKMRYDRGTLEHHAQRESPLPLTLAPPG